MKLIWVIFISMMIGNLVVVAMRGAKSGEDEMTRIGFMLIFDGVVLFLISCFLRMQIVTWSEAFGFKRQWKQAMTVGFLAVALILPGGILLKIASVKVLDRVLSHYKMKTVEQPAVEILQKADSLPDYLMLAMLAMVLAPLSEEILFRGIFYPTIKQCGFPRLALWGTSLAFALIHSDLNAMFSFKLLNFASSLATFIPLTFLALVFVLIYEKTGNLLSCITAHSLFNMVNFVVFCFSKSGDG